MSDKLRINEKLLVSLQEIHSWKGSGTKSDPLIIDSIEGLKSIFKFKKISSHILIKDITIWEIKLIKCRNITIENCMLPILTIIACNNIVVNKCKIVGVKINYSSECIFNNNIFHQNMANLELNEKLIKTSDKSWNFIRNFFIILSIFVISWSIIEFYNSDLFTGFLFLCTSSIPLGIMIDIQIKKKYVKSVGPNIFNNNEVGTLDEISLDFEDYKNEN